MCLSFMYLLWWGIYQNILPIYHFFSSCNIDLRVLYILWIQVLYQKIQIYPVCGLILPFLIGQSFKFWQSLINQHFSFMNCAFGIIAKKSFLLQSQKEIALLATHKLYWKYWHLLPRATIKIKQYNVHKATWQIKCSDPSSD